MIGNNLLIDTNIIIEIFEGNTEIADKINAAAGILISTIVLGELYIGINRVSNKAKHLKKLDSFLSLCEILDIDAETSKHYGEITASLYKKGKPIPSNDIWIAATAKRYDLRLVTRDKHFNQIEKLRIEHW